MVNACEQAEHARNLACPDCGLTIPDIVPGPGSHVHCPQCNCRLYSVPGRGRLHLLPMTLAALLLMVPALTLPLVHLQLPGGVSTISLLGGLAILFREGHLLIAALVTAFCVLAPIALLFAHLLMTEQLSCRIPRQLLASALRLRHRLAEWSMVDIFLLAVMVTWVKLGSTAECTAGTGLVALGLFTATLLAVDSNHDLSRLRKHLGDRQ